MWSRCPSRFMRVALGATNHVTSEECDSCVFGPALVAAADGVESDASDCPALTNGLLQAESAHSRVLGGPCWGSVRNPGSEMSRRSCPRPRMRFPGDPAGGQGCNWPRSSDHLALEFHVQNGRPDWIDRSRTEGIHVTFHFSHNCGADCVWSRQISRRLSRPDRHCPGKDGFAPARVVQKADAHPQSRGIRHSYGQSYFTAHPWGRAGVSRFPSGPTGRGGLHESRAMPWNRLCPTGNLRRAASAEQSSGVIHISGRECTFLPLRVLKYEVVRSLRQPGAALDPALAEAGSGYKSPHCHSATDASGYVARGPCNRSVHYSFYFIRVASNLLSGRIAVSRVVSQGSWRMPVNVGVI